MRLLLDTHSLIWYLSSDSRLSKTALELLADPETDAYVSAASLWEIAIKANLGKLELKMPFEELFPAQLESNDFELLPIEINHLHRLLGLPFHYRDPFDRLLISQAIEESLVILGQDQEFRSYPVAMVW